MGIKELFSRLFKIEKVDTYDFGVLRTMMMLAAVDGDVAAEEMERFKVLALRSLGDGNAAFNQLWEQALADAGYMLMQAKILPRAELVAEFVKKSEDAFVVKTAMEGADDRTRAFKWLESMARADGDYSPVEQDCITQLFKRVEAIRKEIAASRYSRGAAFGA